MQTQITEYQHQCGDGIAMQIEAGKQGWAYFAIKDISIPSGVRAVKFDLDGTGFGPDGEKGSTEGVSLAGVDKCFPDVEEIEVGKNVVAIDIDNRMFPNVRRVISHTEMFMDGVPFLAAKERDCYGRYNGKKALLINAFCLKDGEKFSLAKFSKIQKGAFAWCGQAKISDTKNVEECEDGAFSQEILEKYKSGGVSAIGKILAKAWPDAGGEIILPRGVTCIAKGAFDGARIEEADFTHIPQTELSATVWAFEKVYGIKKYRIDPPYKYWLEENIEPLLNTKKLERIEIPEGNEEFRSIDGAVYSKDGKTLLFCPHGKTGHIDIPEGVEEIAVQAFNGARISSVALPSTIRNIGDYAFVGCNIKEVTIPPSLRYIGRFALPNIEKACLPGGKPVAKLLSSITDAGYLRKNKVPYVLIDMAGFQFTIPVDGTPAKFEDFKDAWNNGNFDENLAMHAFMAASDATVKQDCALLELELHPDDGETRKYIQRSASAIAERYIREKKDKELAKFLHEWDINTKALEKLMKAAEETENESAKSYLMATIEASGGAGKSFRL